MGCSQKKIPLALTQSVVARKWPQCNLQLSQILGNKKKLGSSVDLHVLLKGLEKLSDILRGALTPVTAPRLNF